MSQQYPGYTATQKASGTVLGMRPDNYTAIVSGLLNRPEQTSMIPIDAAYTHASKTLVIAGLFLITAVMSSMDHGAPMMLPGGLYGPP